MYTELQQAITAERQNQRILGKNRETQPDFYSPSAHNPLTIGQYRKAFDNERKINAILTMHLAMETAKDTAP